MTLTGWDLLAIIGTALAVGVVLGAKLTADTLRDHYRGRPDPPPRAPWMVPYPRNAEEAFHRSGTDVFPRAATEDEPWRPSIIPDRVLPDGGIIREPGPPWPWPHLGERRRP